MGIINAGLAFLDHHRVCRLCRQTPLLFATTNNLCTYGATLLDQTVKVSGLTRNEVRELLDAFSHEKLASR